MTRARCWRMHGVYSARTTAPQSDSGRQVWSIAQGSYSNCFFRALCDGDWRNCTCTSRTLARVMSCFKKFATKCTLKMCQLTSTVNELTQWWTCVQKWRWLRQWPKLEIAHILQKWCKFQQQGLNLTKRHLRLHSRILITWGGKHCVFNYYVWSFFQSVNC